MGVKGCQTNWLSHSRSTDASRALAVASVSPARPVSAGEQVSDGVPLTAQLRQGDVDLFAGEVVVFDALRNLPGLAVGGDGRAKGIARGGGRDDALHRVEDSVGGRRGTRGATGLDHGRATLLHAFDERPFEPSLVFDRVGRRTAVDGCV